MANSKGYPGTYRSMTHAIRFRTRVPQNMYSTKFTLEILIVREGGTPAFCKKNGVGGNFMFIIPRVFGLCGLLVDLVRWRNKTNRIVSAGRGSVFAIVFYFYFVLFSFFCLFVAMSTYLVPMKASCCKGVGSMRSRDTSRSLLGFSYRNVGCLPSTGPRQESTASVPRPPFAHA